MLGIDWECESSHERLIDVYRKRINRIQPEIAHLNAPL